MRGTGRRLLCFLAGLAALSGCLQAGELTVRVMITRRLTRKSLSPTIYNLRGVVPPATSGTGEPESEFDRTIVMVEGANVPPPPAQTVAMEQRNRRFEPDLVVIPVGSTVNFPNADPIFHNVFSLSRTQPFDLGYYPQEQSRSVKFPRSGVVQVYCHIHAGMYAAIVVTATPWYGKPSADGTLNWKNLPKGRYRVVAWHKVAGLFDATVEVPENGRASVTLNVPVEAEREF